MTVVSTEFLREIPKADLHVHLDGSMRMGTLIELAKERNVHLPSYTEDGLRDKIFKERYTDLEEYLHGFEYICGLLQDSETLERAAYETAEDAFSEGVRYMEVRLAPQLHVNNELKMADVLEAVDRGLRKSVKERNSRPEVREGVEPPYAYGIIVCALRMFRRTYSRYYRNFMNAHAYSPEKVLFGAASLELARGAVQIRDEGLATLVGFDLAGQENGYPAHDHVEAFRYAHRHFLHKTVHAGEAYGPESIFEAITDLHADRIGHGFYLFDTDKIQDQHVDNRDKYVDELAEYIAFHRMTVEICLSSNLQTNPNLESLAEHPVKRMIDSRISVTFCTDNRMVSNTTLGRELKLAVEELGLTHKQLRDCVFNGFKRSFIPLPYLDKREYVRKVINYYDAIEQKYNLT